MDLGLWANDESSYACPGARVERGIQLEVVMAS
jgi:hypothetical protein